MSLYYQYMETYMGPALFAITLEVIYWLQVFSTNQRVWLILGATFIKLAFFILFLNLSIHHYKHF